MKKKVNDLLKGVAGAGVALGGAAAFGEMDVVYASELEDVTSQNNAEEYDLEDMYASLAANSELTNDEKEALEYASTAIANSEANISKYEKMSESAYDSAAEVYGPATETFYLKRMVLFIMEQTETFF